MATFCQQIAANKAVTDKGLYTLAAAHACLMSADYTSSRKLLDEAKS
ncbi:hypothetical protein [Paraflavitalea speifideaquila]|nr:hypothetical protein [Paraflavitalea speifideiaquila]